MPYQKLYEYYVAKGFSPTFAKLADSAALTRYAADRVRVFTDKLSLPPRSFRGARVLEFGPDTGENALVFAGWGANMVLAEPNQAVHDIIRSYFAGFGLGGSLKALVPADVESFSDTTPFDIIVAEGFIYTIQPNSRWLARLAGLLAPGGQIIVSYYERHGAFLELCLKAILSAYRRLTGDEPVAAARALYQVKWDSIPHTRAFESWVNDVLVNPFVRLDYFIDAAELLADAQAQGLTLYSSWPVYRQPLMPYWHKRSLPPQQELERDRAHLRRSALSFVLGDLAYIAAGDPGKAASLQAVVDDLLKSIDAIIDATAPTAALPRAVGALEQLERALSQDGILTEGGAARQRHHDTLAAIKHILQAADAGDAGLMKRLCFSDTAFIAAWGMPTHYAVLQRPAQA